ncbi:sugar ABC transporter substrate-binding protein [Streptomyces sp. 8K308]|uniref:sugar ABC transporter substrate-binding protein n=1 Tax=Streptomyces sp. 8K308 TaxID=2530388 RepID=UPI0010429406|nr:substrate-binding domain-containing protein [Streptomyces sp. 8K308]TDC27588.1 sugar ABC transporter substrate-binding protein [Streptomyces sp. 8K308]
MATVTRGAAVVVVAASLAAGLAACGERNPGGGGERGRQESGFEVGLLLPDKQVARWESFDRPLMERRVRELCGDCRLEAVNAQNDVAVQQQQMDSMITRGVGAIILTAVDATAIHSSVERAEEAGIPVVAYDRLAEGPVSAYVSFDNRQVGREQGEALLRALDERGGDQIVMVNGSPTDPNTALFREGALSVLEGEVDILREYDTPGWISRFAYGNVTAAVADLGPEEIHGVLAANDSVAAGTVAALRAARIDPLPPVTGQDAELAALQRIVAGTQYQTVYKPYEDEARPAAELAVALTRGEPLDDIARDRVATDGADDIPAVLATPVSVTVDDIEDTVVRDGLVTIDQLCTRRFEDDCRRAGLLD